MPSLA